MQIPFKVIRGENWYKTGRHFQIKGSKLLKAKLPKITQLNLKSELFETKKFLSEIHTCTVERRKPNFLASRFQTVRISDVRA